VPGNESGERDAITQKPSLSQEQARVVIGDWKRGYDCHRPHSALNYQPPARYAANCTHQ